jgi:hypothetical protein
VHTAVHPVNAALLGVSCPGPADCFAAGHFTPGGRGQHFHGLIEHFNGKSWSVVPVPLPPTAFSTWLQAVSCASATDCMAVGHEVPHGGGLLPFAEHWDGHTWSLAPPAVAPGAQGGEFLGVSCPAPGSCQAVGDEEGPGIHGPTVALAEHWDGTRWSVTLSMPNPTKYESLLVGVSCATVTDCDADGWISPLGTDLSFAAAEHWDGTAWRLASAQRSAKLNDSVLFGMGCAAGGSCLAGGEYFDRKHMFTQHILAEWGTGGHWSVVPAPIPAGGFEPQISGSFCNTASVCMAVGSVVLSPENALVPLADHWDGHRLSMLSPLPSPRGGSGFDAVSCPSPALCVATGAQTTSAGIETFTEVWQHGVWRIVPSPTPR